MSQAATGGGVLSATRRWLNGLWEYYREYTHTAVHTASAAALTAFGLLVFIDRLFVLLAIAVYIFPPVVLYSLDSDVGRRSNSSMSTTVRGESETTATDDSTLHPGTGDSDSDSADSDTDADGLDTDTDVADTDTDADGVDTDTDADGVDTDTDTDN